jgi:signal transduction histidine kinase
VGAGDCGGGLPPRRECGGLLDDPGCGDGQSLKPTTRRSIALTAEQTNPEREELERLRAEVGALRASRTRLVLAGDADCRTIEGDLHESVQQHLVALAVKLQLAAPLLDGDPAVAGALVEEMQRDVQEALENATRLAHRIYPQVLESGGLGAALRFAAESAGIPASVDVTVSATYAPEILRTVYLCWLEALEQARGTARATATVREEYGALTFEFAGVAEWSVGLDGLRDRAEALGGQLTFERGGHVFGSLPVSS